MAPLAGFGACTGGMTATVTGHGSDQRSYQIATVGPGFPGEVAPGSRLYTLAGYRLGPALGALLLPVSAGGQGYVFVAWLHVLGEHPQPWAITGLTVRYELRQKEYTGFFPQEIKLPPISCPQH